MRPGPQIGGTSIHVGDCRVWAEIYYLDSATDYREYLPNKPCCKSGERELTMLDENEKAGLGWRRVLFLSLVLVFALVAAKIVLGY